MKKPQTQQPPTGVPPHVYEVMQAQPEIIFVGDSLRYFSLAALSRDWRVPKNLLKKQLTNWGVHVIKIGVKEYVEVLDLERRLRKRGGLLFDDASILKDAQHYAAVSGAKLLARLKQRNPASNRARGVSIEERRRKNREAVRRHRAKKKFEKGLDK